MKRLNNVFSHSDTLVFEIACDNISQAQELPLPLGFQSFPVVQGWFESIRKKNTCQDIIEKSSYMHAMEQLTRVKFSS